MQFANLGQNKVKSEDERKDGQRESVKGEPERGKRNGGSIVIRRPEPAYPRRRLRIIINQGGCLADGKKLSEQRATTVYR